MTLKITCLDVLNKLECTVDSSGFGVGGLLFFIQSLSTLQEVVRFI